MSGGQDQHDWQIIDWVTAQVKINDFFCCYCTVVGTSQVEKELGRLSISSQWNKPCSGDSRKLPVHKEQVGTLFGSNWLNLALKGISWWTNLKLKDLVSLERPLNLVREKAFGQSLSRSMVSTLHFLACCLPPSSITSMVTSSSFNGLDMLFS